MKIRIKKKQLLESVKFTFSVVNKTVIDKKIVFYYFENKFIIINYFDNKKMYVLNDYYHFRKKINEIIKNW